MSRLRAIAATSRRDGIHGSGLIQAAPLVERDDHLARLVESLAASREGRGGVAVVEGPAGIGRTALLDRLAIEAVTGGSRVLRAQGSASECGYALGVVRQLLEAIIVTTVGNQRDTLLSGGAEMVCALLESHGDPDLDYRALHGLYRLLANIAHQVPVLVLVDDAHRADQQSLRWLAYLAQRVRDLPVLVVLSRTAGEAPPCGQPWPAIAAAPGCRTLTLEPLSGDGVQRLAGRVLGGDADGAFSAACHELTGGNLRLLTELLEALSRDGIPPCSDQVESVRWYGRWTLSEMVQGHLRHLPADCLRLIGAVSILGAGCDLGVAGQLCGLAQAEVMNAAHTLVEARLAQCGPALTLTADLVGEAVLAGLSPEQRARMSSNAAALLFDAGTDAEQVAAQLLEAEPAGQQWRVTVLREAAQRVLRRDPPRAEAFLHRALREPPDEPAEIIEILHLLANTESALALKEFADAAIKAARVCEERRDDDSYARAESLRAECLFMAGRARSACDVLEHAADRVRERSPDARSFLVAHRLMIGAASFAAWQVINATPWAAEPTPEGATAGERALLAVRGYLHTLRGERTEGARLATRALERGAATDRTAQPAGVLAAKALLFGDRWTEGTTWLETIVAGSDSGDEPIRDVYNHLTLADAYQRMGDLAAAVERADHAVGLLGCLHRVRREQMFPGRLAHVYVQVGQLDRAEQLLVQYPPADGDQGWLASRLLITRGHLRMAQGRASEAVEAFLEAGRCLAAWGFDDPVICSWRSLAAKAHHALSRHHEARRLAHEELEIAVAGGDPYAIGVGMRAAGLVTPGQGGLGLLRSAVAALEATPARLELSEALIALGAAENREGAAARARPLLRRGMFLAEQSGAAPLAEQGRRQLCLAGGRPRGAHLLGAMALTFMERQVTQLAREGQTNREIAADLHVVQRTVEIHLGNAYRKLGISRRTELASVLN